MPRIFISYRRSDSKTFVGRVYERLVRTFGADNVFRDIDDIPAGSDFRKILAQEIDRCDVLLVIIGSTWADEHNRKRLENIDDFVRIEVETALRLPSKVVIPVLVGGADMPTAESLPSTLRELTYRNAVQVRDDPDFAHDMETLSGKIKQISGRNRLPIWGVAAALIIGVVIVAFFLSRSSQSPETAQTETAQPEIVNASDTPPPPTETATDAPTATSQSMEMPTSTAVPPTETPTNTSSPPSETPRPTNTSPPPDTLAAAPLATTAEDEITLAIFSDSDSLTLYVPALPDGVMLTGLAWQVSGETKTYTLDNYSGFRGMFELLSMVGAACFHLEKQGSSEPVPQKCQSGVQLFKQPVAPADVFWFDATTNTARSILLLRDEAALGVCPAGQAECGIAITALAHEPTDSVPASGSVRCGNIVFRSGASMSVRVAPLAGSPSKNQPGVLQGSSVVILEERMNEGKKWFLIQYSRDDTVFTGWIVSDEVEPSSCS